MTSQIQAARRPSPAADPNPWELLEKDHRSLNSLISRTRRAIGTDELDVMRERLLHRLGCHLNMEETVVFPVLLAASGGSAKEAVEILYEEHRDIHEAMEEFRTASDEQASETFEEMRERLRQHQARERRVLYPVSQQLCPPALGALLAEKIQECRKRRR